MNSLVSVILLLMNSYQLLPNLVASIFPLSTSLLPQLEFFFFEANPRYDISRLVDTSAGSLKIRTQKEKGGT